jgi:quinol monooxygenase YgiN
MATILAHIRVKPDKAAQFEATVRPLYARSHAEETALLRYEYWRGEEENRYYVLLAFKDYAGFMVHQSSAHHEAAVPALQDAIEELRLEWLSPVVDASPLPSSSSPELPADASDLMRRYATLFPMASPDWWRRA